MPFNPNVPQAIDFLSDSQLDLLNNNIQLDASFGVDHYAFSNLTANNGKHNYVTTPKAVNTPPTATGHPDVTATELRFYAMEDTANIGLLQYSRGWDFVNSTSAIPCPVTFLQSQATGLIIGAAPATLAILDFTNITKLAMATIYAVSLDPTAARRFYLNYDIVWNGSSFRIIEVAKTGASGISITSTGNILQINNSNVTPGPTEIYWVLKFHRIQMT